MKQRRLTVRVVASLALIGVITVAHVRVLSANPTTVALTYLVAILFVATGWGIAEATSASLLAVFCLNFFFLPPLGTLTIADPQNWVALVAFLATAIVASQLSGRARRRTVEALGRQRDLEHLYALSRALLLTPSTASLLSEMTRHIADSFAADAVAMYDQQTAMISRAGPRDVAGIDERLREAVRAGAPIRDADDLIVLPLRLGTEPIGSLAIVAAGIDDTVLQSIANLAAIGLERARSQELGAGDQVDIQSGELRATVLDAVAHEFKTPLTSLKAAAGDLLESIASPREHELAQIVAEETNRLQGIVSDAVQMLRIESGGFAVQRGRHSLARLVAASLDELTGLLAGHTVVNKIRPDAMIEADAELVQLALRQLINNAVKYSPPSSVIEIDAADRDGQELIVRNSGSMIPDHEQRRVFDRFFRGSTARNVPGTGMGLAIVEQIARAHGGAVSVASSAGVGTEFRLSLPATAAMS